jgi:hypothetical protein
MIEASGRFSGAGGFESFDARVVLLRIHRFGRKNKC